MTYDGPDSISVTRRGDVGRGAVSYAQSKVAAVLADVKGPVLGAKVVLDWRRNPAVGRPACADVGVNVNGTVVRARSERRTMQEAIDELHDRLRRRITAVEDRRAAQRHPVSRRQPTQPSAEERASHTPSADAIVRERAQIAELLTPEEASYEMDLVDHDFFLFHDSSTGSPALLRRAGPHSCIIDALPPTMTEAEAHVRLEVTSEPVFYIETGTDEARVLHLHAPGRAASIALPALPQPERVSPRPRHEIGTVVTS